MSTNPESRSLKQLLAEADELMQRIHSDATKDLKEVHRIEVEKHAENLRRAKSTVQDKMEYSEAYPMSRKAEGMHEAIQEITKAMGQLKNYFFGDRQEAVK